jgi:anti-sigma B factor antagonist
MRDGPVDETMALCPVREKGGIIIAALPLNVDHVAAMTVEKELRELAFRGPEALLLDFSGTKYVSSSGLRVFLLIAKMTEAAGIPFGVFSLSPFVGHTFSMSGFANILSIYDTEDAAVRAVSRR